MSLYNFFITYKYIVKIFKCSAENSSENASKPCLSLLEKSVFIKAAR